MATLNFPDNPSTGDTYTDSNAGFTYEWNGTVWISKDPSTASNIREIDDISGSFNGSTTAFTLQVASVNVEPANVQQLIISVGGVMQNAGDDYTVSGSTLTFTTAPTAGLTFFGTLLGTALSLNTVADGSVSPSSLTTTSNYMMGGLTVDQNAGIITAYKFEGDGSGLIGVASTDNIITSYGATFLSNVRIAGVLTAANAYVTGILTAQTLNYNNVVDIYSTGIITATRGIQQTGNEGLHVSSGITTVGIFTATSARVGLGVTINNTGIDAGAGVVTAFKAELGIGVTINNTGIDAGIGAGIITAKQYFGDATNMTGAGSTFQILTVSPYQGEQLSAGTTSLGQDIIIGFNHAISAGNADKNITLRTGSASGDVVETFDVDSDITYSYSQARMDPASNFELEETYFVVVDEGAVMKVGTATSSPLVNGYSFSTANAFHQLWTWGDNEDGVLGQNVPYAGRSSPTKVGSDENWGPRGAIASDNTNNYMFNIKLNGTLWAWGRNDVGVLGQNGSIPIGTKISSPTQIGANTNWANVQCGAEGATFAVKTDGTLWSWGQNKNGELAQNSQGDGTNTFSSPTQVGTQSTWNTQQLATATNSFMAIKTDGTLWNWGNGYQGQLGHNQPGAIDFSSPVQVGTDTTWDGLSRGAAGSNNYFATKTDGTLWAWGRGDYGILALNNETYYSSPTQVGTDTTWRLIMHSQDDENNIALATKSDGTLWSWGSAGAGSPSKSGARGLNGETKGAPSNVAFSSPMQVGTDTTWPTTKSKNYRLSGGTISVGSVKTDGTLWVWGDNEGGQLGQNNQGTRYSSPVQVNGTDWDSIFINGANSSQQQSTQATTKQATPG